MKEFWIGILVGAVVVVGSLAPRLFSSPSHSALIRNCSMTGTHIIDDNTIVVCQVLKIRQRETPVPNGNTKPPENPSRDHHYPNVEYQVPRGGLCRG